MSSVSENEHCLSHDHTCYGSRHKTVFTIVFILCVCNKQSHEMMARLGAVEKGRMHPELEQFPSQYPYALGNSF